MIIKKKLPQNRLDITSYDKSALQTNQHEYTNIPKFQVTCNGIQDFQLIHQNKGKGKSNGEPRDISEALE